MDVGLLNNRRERPLGLPTRLQQRGEVSSVADPGHLQLHRPYPRVPGALPVTVALSCASGTPLVTPCAYVLFYFHLHECLGEHPDALLEEVCVLIDHRLAQQLRESYPQFIGHRASSFGRLVSSEGTTRWPSSSTAFAFYTLTRTLPKMGRKVPSRRSVGLRYRRVRGFSDSFGRGVLGSSYVRQSLIAWSHLYIDNYLCLC